MMSLFNGQEVFSNRTGKLRSCIPGLDKTALLVFKHEDIYYLTGFYGKDSDSILIISSKNIYLLVNFIFLEDARKSMENSSIDIIFYKGSRIKKAVEIISSINVRSVLLEDSKIKYSDFIGLKKELKGSKKELVVRKDIIGPLRIIKDEHELESIKNACNITDTAFNEILNYSSKKISGFSELSLGNKLEGICIKNGGFGRSFDYVVASGPGSSKPHYSSSQKKISGNILLIDFGTIYNKYCSDMTRTIFLEKGCLNSKLKSIYKIVLEAQNKTLDACMEGLRCDELDNIARKHIEDKGYGKYFGHGLGHGVGLEVHEEPYVSRKSSTILKENMVITLEPGIYIPDLGGVRIEDMVIIGKNGCTNLYSSKKDFTFLP